MTEKTHKETMIEIMNLDEELTKKELETDCLIRQSKDLNAKIIELKNSQIRIFDKREKLEFLIGIKKIMLVKEYSFKESPEVLFKKVFDDNDSDCEDFEEFKDQYFEEFKDLYENGLSRVIYDDKDLDFSCFTLFDVVYYAVFNNCLCYDSGESSHENIERYHDNFRNENKILRNGYDVFLNVIHEELILDCENEIIYEKDDATDY